MEKVSTKDAKPNEVMTVKYIYRVKGTILQGKLCADVKIGDNVTIVTEKEERAAKIMSIAVSLSDTANEAKAGTECGLLFLRINDLEIQPGDKIIPGSSNGRIGDFESLDERSNRSPGALQREIENPGRLLWLKAFFLCWLFHDYKARWVKHPEGLMGYWECSRCGRTSYGCVHEANPEGTPSGRRIKSLTATEVRKALK